ncbi:hypothetical protein MFIFM68171_02982 [Madurella fahalii]|uniref:Heterokaryon incompatibility domain-containing protein n=1 Tax=Madurella fahalii TaxID=1157608 RepID=A0ABQ0G4S6_9PEZI
MAAIICRVCFDLEYDRYDPGVGLGGCGYFYPLTRYRQSNWTDIEAAADAGCSFCKILHEGIQKLWVKPMLRTTGGSPETGCEKSDDWETDNSEPESEDGEGQDAGGEGMGDSDEEGSDWEGDILIELRPGRSLRIKQLVPKWSLSSVTPCLEYFTDTGERGCVPTLFAFCVYGLRLIGDTRAVLSRAFGGATHVLKRLDLRSAVKMVKKWLEVCEKHAVCSEPSQTTPKRLLDLATAAPKLTEVGAKKQGYIRYATLSHCWGDASDSKPLCTTKETYRTRTRGIEWTDLPPLFQDAINITKELGCRYLWIDSLCIIQDDEEDWLEQSADMGDIYSSGYINLAAAAAPNSSHTIFDERWQFQDWYGHQRRYTPVTVSALQSQDADMATIYVRHMNQHSHGCVMGDLLHSRELESPLLGRAWVLQEKLLSRRTVFFAKSGASLAL